MKDFSASIIQDFKRYGKCICLDGEGIDSDRLMRSYVIILYTVFCNEAPTDLCGLTRNNLGFDDASSVTYLLYMAFFSQLYAAAACIPESASPRVRSHSCPNLVHQIISLI